MRSLTALFVLFLLAGSVNDRGAPSSAPDSTRGASVDRHIDAHVPVREGERAASAPDARSERRSAPDPAQGTSVLEPPVSPPAIQSPRDPLYRRY